MSSPILSILICSIVERAEKLKNLLWMLNAQRNSLENPDCVEILYIVDNRELTVGAKRNKLMAMATGEYLVYHDDDDRPMGDYIPKILKPLETKPDCVDMCGFITWEKKNPNIFTDGIQYKASSSNQGCLGNPANHLCPIKASIAKQVKFPEINYGEDKSWAQQISKLLKTSITLTDPIYYYDFDRNQSSVYKGFIPRQQIRPAVVNKPLIKQRVTMPKLPIKLINSRLLTPVKPILTNERGK